VVSLDKGRHHFSLSLQSADQGTSARDATRIQHGWSRDTVAQWHHHVRFNGTGPSKGVLAAERADAVAERGASGGRSSPGHEEAVVAAELRTAQPPSSIGIIAAVAVLLPGLFAGLTVPLPFLIGDRHSMPGTYWWQRFLVGVETLGFGAGAVGVLSIPIAIPLAAWAIRREGLGRRRGRAALALATLSVLGLCTWLLVAVRPAG
jgi:hypothetical protein